MINISKREEAPATLAIEKEKRNGSYSGEDVIDALVEDSHNKCYLCEDSLITTIHVEHFQEHRGNKDLKFDWHNLHYSCGHCNATKNDTFRSVPSDLLNCADENCKVDYWIIYRMDDEDLKSKVVIIRNQDADVSPFEVQTANTIQLLDKIYNGTGTPTRNQEARNLRDRVLQEIVPFQEKLLRYITSTDPDVKEELKRELADGITPSSRFVAFKKWLLRDNGVAPNFSVNP